jgi:DNA polymerase I
MSERKYCEIDFEFFNSKEEYLDVVCCSLRLNEKSIHEFWLLDGEETDKFKSFLAGIQEQGYIMVAHSAPAEMRSLLSLYIDPEQFDWIDTFIEWRHITNHHKEFRYGKHLIKGKIKNLIPARFDKWKPEDSQDRLSHNLAEMVFKLLDEQIDQDHKDKMRDIILSKDRDLINQHRTEIQEYCTSDIMYLMPCLRIITKEYAKLYKGEDRKNIISEMILRGNQMLLVAQLETLGYPIDLEAARNFSNAVPQIIADIQRDINEQFPQINPFHWDKKTEKFVTKEKPIQTWIENSRFCEEWDKTPTGRYSLSLDAFAKFFPYRHDYPRGNFGAQFLRYLKTNQALKGFVATKDGSFWDYVGSDGRARAYINAYGSQSGRFQPGSTGFLFLKPAWTRSLCVPPEGYGIAGIDYKSQEYLIAALESQDKAMIESYRSGDVYIAYAISAGLAPKGATKKTHGEERELSKPVVLAINYDMSKYGLAHQLSEKLDREIDPEEAQEYIDLFYNTYHVFGDYKERIQSEYEVKKYLRSPHGWTLWGDNYNFRSVGNFPVQGAGASILWKALELCHKAGLKVVIPLHDALYIQYPLDKKEECLEKFAECMREAFDFYYPDSGIMLEGETWSPTFSTGKFVTKKGVIYKVEPVHIDERAHKEYEVFSKYFKSIGSDLI